MRRWNYFGTGGFSGDWSSVAFNSTCRRMSLSGGYLYCVGAFTDCIDAAGTHTGFSGMARLNTSTIRWDTGWKPAYTPGGATLWGLAVDGTGAYIGGSFSGLGGISRSGIGKVDLSTGAGITAFNAGAGASIIDDITIDGSSIYAANGATSTTKCLKFDTTTGAVDSTFSSGQPSISNSTQGAYRPYVDGSTVWISGSFDGNSPEYLRQLNKTSGADSGFDVKIDAGGGRRVWPIISYGSIYYVGGVFAGINAGASTRNNAAAWDASQVLQSWNPNFNTDVRCLMGHISGIYCGGGFDSIGGVTHKRLVRTDPSTGANDTTFDAAFTQSTASAVEDLVEVIPNLLAICGTFSSGSGTIGGATRVGIAFLNIATGAVV